MTQQLSQPRVETSGDAKSLKLFYAHELGRGITYLAVGRNYNLEGKLIQSSRQPHILATTPNDAERRFKDRESLEGWFAKDRTMHWLLGKDAELAGVIWYGPEAYPLASPKPPTHTFAIRLYEGYIGKKLAQPFMELSLRHYAGAVALDKAFSGLWLETDDDNFPALSTYNNVGYQEAARDKGRVTMVLSPEQIRNICDPGA